MTQEYDLFYGSDAAGGAPTFSVFKNHDTGADLPPPAVEDLGAGFYRFGVDWSSLGAQRVRYVLSLQDVGEKADILAAPGVVGSTGTLAPAPGSQNLALFPTAKTVVNRALAQAWGKPAQGDPFASTDPDYVLARELLTTLGDDLLNAHLWTHLVRSCLFTTDGVSVAYALPPDFQEMIDQTFWNRSTRLPGIGPLSRQQSSALQARLVSIVLNVSYQIQGGTLAFPIVPPRGAACAFDYLSTFWVQGSAAPGPDKDRPALADDVLLLDEELLVAGLKMKLLEERGFDTAKAEERFQTKLEACKGKNDPGPVLSLGSGSRNAFDRMIDGANVPLGNWPA